MQSEAIIHPFMEAATDGKLAALNACLETLKIEQKSCVQLFYFEGKSYKEIAEFKNIAVGKVRSFIQNGRRNLKLCIEEKAAV